jgi:hypothetical protein
MHAAPSVRVCIDSPSMGRAFTVALWFAAGAALGIWLSWLGVSMPTLALGAAIGFALTCGLLWRGRREALVLRWDGQRWFREHQGESTPGCLRMYLDIDGRSLLSFALAVPGRRPKQWLWATPRTVQGPWQDWRAALVQSSREPAAQPGVSNP